MTASAPWSVKGIDPKAREVAKDLARRSGMTLGEWLNHVILEDEGGEAGALPPAFGDRSGLGWSAPASPRPPAEADRNIAALDRLAHRIEASETRVGLAVSGVEHALRQALARLEATEREQLGVAGWVDGTRAAVAQLGDRLSQIEAGPRSPEALKVLEERIASVEAQARPQETLIATIQALAARLAEAEVRTGAAIDELKQTTVELDSRIQAADAVGQAVTEQRLEVVAGKLDRQIGDLRREFAARIEAATGARLDARFDEINAHLQSLERRSAQAVERMGKELMHIADAVNKRIQGSEERSAEAIERVGGEIARIAGAVEGRLERAEGAQANALEKLGAEIGRITDRLTDRLAATERNSALAIDEIGLQVAKVAERIEQRHDQAAADMSERLLESEARTARFLAEARAQLAVDAAPGPVDLAPPPTGGVDDDDPLTSSMFVKAEVDACPRGAADLDDIFELSDRRALPDAREAIAEARASAVVEQPPAPPFSTRTKVEPSALSGAMFKGFGAPRAPKRAPSTLQTALMVAGGAAFLGLSAAGVSMMEAASPPTSRYAEAPAEPRAAVALASEVGPGTTRTGPSDDAAFVKASQALESGGEGAVENLRALADRGNPAALLTLGQLYEAGRSGLKQDLAEARRLTQLAAEAGNESAMYNLGLYLFRGEGGPQDMAAAAAWFRKAAALGVVDSQFNLGLMYQTGSGVKKDPAEAYKWFSLAASQGDTLSATSAADLKAKLSPAVLRQADAAVAAAQAVAVNSTNGAAIHRR